jgi:hypothetical protein
MEYPAVDSNDKAFLLAIVQDFSTLVEEVLARLNTSARGTAVPRDSGKASSLVQSRNSALGNCTALYNRCNPLHITCGKDSQLYDEEGTRYLDCVNNVSHVGHSNQRVCTFELLEWLWLLITRGGAQAA